MQFVRLWDLAPQPPSTSFAVPVVELGSISGLLLGGPIVEVGEVVSMASPLGDSGAAIAEGRIGICLDLGVVSSGTLKVSRGACSTIVLNISTTEYRQTDCGSQCRICQCAERLLERAQCPPKRRDCLTFGFNDGRVESAYLRQSLNRQVDGRNMANLNGQVERMEEVSLSK